MASAGGKDWREGEMTINRRAAEKKPETLMIHIIFSFLGPIRWLWCLTALRCLFLIRDRSPANLEMAAGRNERASASSKSASLSVVEVERQSREEILKFRYVGSLAPSGSGYLLRQF